MKTHKILSFSIFVVLTILLTQLGLPLGGPTAVHAADGVAQLKILTDYPIKSVIVSGTNQNNDAVTWEKDYGDNSIRQEVSIDNWWWRFKWFCPGWNPFCHEDEFPSPDTISPYVWVRYTDGILYNQRCIPSEINRNIDLVVCQLPHHGPKPFLHLPFEASGYEVTSYFDHTSPNYSRESLDNRKNITIFSGYTLSDNCISMYSDGSNAPDCAGTVRAFANTLWELPHVYYSGHDGFDFGFNRYVSPTAPVTITAAYRGLVTFVGWAGACGWMIEIAHDDIGSGYKTRYCHLVE